MSYTIRATLQTYTIRGTDKGMHTFPNGTLVDDVPVSMFTRTFEGVASASSSKFCSHDDDGTTGPLGPCLQVLPGDKIKLRLINDMDHGMEALHQDKVPLEKYWKFAQKPNGPKNPLTMYGPIPDTPEDMHITNKEDLPGWDVTYDDTNLHFHGMQVVPHLFYPQGTGDPTAPWITTQPASELNATTIDRRCFCYVMDVPADHPQGLFFYHIHRHGSAAMQGWQGMVGLIQVGDVNSPGSPQYELAGQGVTRMENFVLWEWAVLKTTQFTPRNNTFYEGDFYDHMYPDEFIRTILTNNEYQPTYQNVCLNEIVHFQLLCAQTSVKSALYILDEKDNVVEFYAFASDGINFGGNPIKKTSLVVAPGYRQGLLLTFNATGTYRIMQTTISTIACEQCVHAPKNAVVQAFIEVVADNGRNGCTSSPTPVTELVFTPGMKHSIEPEEVSTEMSIHFQVPILRDRYPTPQFKINGREYNISEVTKTMKAGAATSWTLSSEMNWFHPFHIHVNPFQVILQTEGKLPEWGNLVSARNLNITMKDALLLTNSEPKNMWRDTVSINPYGMVNIRQRFGDSIAWTGKTVFHCHLLNHEDSGMIANMVIADPRVPSPPVPPPTRSPSNVPRPTVAPSLLKVSTASKSSKKKSKASNSGSRH